ncbi:MAG TPA: alanine racemase [Propylenella sp.]|nr:alanine racemase [Propylenella sp.]
MSENGAAAGLTLTIDLGALARNWTRLAARAAPAECAAVVKADAYGIGIEHAVPALSAAGCRNFFVALPAEAVRVRAVAATATVYVLGGFFSEAAETYLASGIRPVLNHPDELEAWIRTGGGRPAALHVDTGMNRLGFFPEDALALAGSQRLSDAGVVLLMSHLACADQPGHPKNADQLALFKRIRERFGELPASFANSHGIALGPDYHFDIVRPGIALYGGARAMDPEMDVVVTAAARVLQVRRAAAGQTVGYGATQKLARTSRLAILAAGYADGYHRAASASGERPGAAVFIGGRRAPLAGRISMDLMAIDVTNIAARIRPGDSAELFGPNIPVEEVAAAAGTISYELLTHLGRRAERFYINAPGPR